MKCNYTNTNAFTSNQNFTVKLYNGGLGESTISSYRLKELEVLKIKVHTMVKKKGIIIKLIIKYTVKN